MLITSSQGDPVWECLTPLENSFAPNHSSVKKGHVQCIQEVLTVQGSVRGRVLSRHDLNKRLGCTSVFIVHRLGGGGGGGSVWDPRHTYTENTTKEAEKYYVETQPTR